MTMTTLLHDWMVFVYIAGGKIGGGALKFTKKATLLVSFFHPTSAVFFFRDFAM